VSLSWPAVTNATSYSIRRSGASGGPYTEVGTSTTTSHVNTVAAGTYYYVVAAVNSCGTGANSAQVSGVSSGGGSEPCTPSATFTGTVTNSGGFNTAGAYCFRTDFNINGWGCSNFDGRTVSINDATPTSTCGGLPMPTKYNGYYYFESSAGSLAWASIYWW